MSYIWGDKKRQRFFFLLLGAILLVLFFMLKPPKTGVNREIKSVISAWDSLIKNKRLETELGLTYVWSTKIPPHPQYGYLYPRRYTTEHLSQEITNLLGDSGIKIRRENIEGENKNISFEIGSKDFLITELFCSPDMSTFAGKICLIIDDFGYNLNSVVKQFLKLDIPATFAIIPGHAYSRRVADLASKEGFEIMIHMPMESKDFLPGEDDFILSKRMTREEIRSRLSNAFHEIPQAKGVNNHQGSDATESRRVMRIVAEVLKAEGKYFIDSKTSAKSVAVDQMKQAKVPVAVRAVFVDYEDQQDIVAKQLKQLAKMSREKGMAIGIAHPRINTLTVFRKEIPRLKDEGFDFILGSEVVN